MKKLLILALFAAVTFCAAAQELTVATYNIRNANRGDAERGNGWERRGPWVCRLIEFHGFDIFGSQEVLDGQLHDMLAQLPDYDYIGVGRDDGAAGGEYSAIFYKRGRFRLLDSGHFWLSEDPSKPGKGWDAKYVRICTWGRFYDRQSRQRFWFFTTHTDHRGEQAQAESCRLILAKIEELCRGERVILTGDFNVGETSRSYAILRDSGILSDTYDTAEIRYAETGTENWFDPDIKTFRRIDYLFVTPGFRVLRYGILTDTYRSENPDGEERKFRARTPSDHFPVQVELEFTKR